MQRDHVVAALEGRGEPPPLRPKHARRVRFIDHQHGLVAIRNCHEIGKVRAVAIHAVQAFDRKPGPTLAAARAPTADRCVEGVGIIMRRPDEISASGPKPFVDAGMHQFVMNDQIATLWQRREDREIGNVAAAKIERCFGAEIGRRFALKRFMLGMITAQKARSTRSNRHASCQRVTGGPFQFLGFSQTQIVVRTKIYTRPLTKLPQPPKP